MEIKLSLASDSSNLQSGVEFIKKALQERGLSSKEVTRNVLTAEEVLVKLIANAPDNNHRIDIEVGGLLGNIMLTFKARGKAFELSELESGLMLESEDDEVNAVIRRMLDKLLGENLQVRNVKDVNIVTMRVQKSYYAGLVYTLLALIMGIATGIAMQASFSPDEAKVISDNFFVPVYTVFMNTLKMVVGPLVFCSMAASLADFGDLKALGRIALRVALMYVFTSAIAICIGYLTYRIFPIGEPSLAQAVSAEAASATLEKGQAANVSIRDTLVGIVPTDIATPFRKANMLQIIFLGICVGVGAAAISRKFPLGKDIINVCNLIVLKITSVLVGFIPVIVFCSMAKMMITMDISRLLDVFVWIPVIYFGDILMICAYLILLLIFAGLNPITFLKKYYPAMVSAFTLCSSNASLPTSIKQCNELGVSPKVYSFSLPLGATINMDGSCIAMMITALFFARIFNIPVTGSVLTSLFVAIIALSLGSPGVPGGNLVCIALLVPQIGVPAEAISLIMGLYPLMDMMQSCTNVTGDAVATTIVARQEGLFDKAKFDS